MRKQSIQIISIISFILLSITLNAQVISSNPAFPQEGQSVVITFNSTQGSGGLANYAGDIYAHIGVITNQSSSDSDWKYVKTGWGVNTPETKLISIGNNEYTLSITPDIRAYFGVPTSETIEKIAMVFRSDVAVGGSYLEGKNADNSDIFQIVYAAGANVSLVKPSNGYMFSEINDIITITASKFSADSLLLLHNDTVIKRTDADNATDNITVSSYGKHWIKAIAKTTTESVADSFYYYVPKAVTVEALPTGVIDGINYISDTEVILCLYAPNKNFSFVIGDFNNWELEDSFYMKKTPDNNYFWLKISNLIPQQEYVFQYFVDGDVKIGDPYAEKVSDPWNDKWIDDATYPNMLDYPNGKTEGIASVLQTDQGSYTWNTSNFVAPQKDELVIYELLIRDFTAKHTFQSVIDSLNYLKELGINAIELMPINEFEGNNSWGYNPNYYFAVDKYYGTKDDFKRLVDTAHSMGIAIILDVVYNHSFGTSPYVKLWWDANNNRPAADNPFFNVTPKHDFNVGFDMNHESAATKKYISRAVKFWIEEYKIDGFRFDLSKGFTQKNTLGDVGEWGHKDAGRIHILKSYADSIFAVNPDAYVILEHFADNDEEKDLSANMMLWGNLNHAYAEAAMGYNTSGKSDFSWISYQERGWTNSHVVGYMESHDEERLMYKASQWGNVNGGYSIKNKNVFMRRASLNAAFFLTVPGPKMIWQFGELGYDISIDYNGRTGEKPIKWDYMDDDDRKNNYAIYAAINKLRADESACFQTTDYDMDVNGALKQITLRHSSMNLVTVGNFDVIPHNYTVTMPHSGTWYDYFSGDTIEVINTNYTFALDMGLFHIYTDKSITTPDLPLGIGDNGSIKNNNNTLKIYPNPSNGDVLKVFISTKDKVELSIINMEGRTIFTQTNSQLGDRIINLNDMGLPSGIYFCRIMGKNTNEIVKFIVI
ncbi:MAG: alpha-amylase [Bacteroidetes bacterium 4572_112]|nr:MAG: alpha-amylase [Bacteroidetes bacterium 4572_112]